MCMPGALPRQPTFLHTKCCTSCQRCVKQQSGQTNGPCMGSRPTCHWRCCSTNLLRLCCSFMGVTGTSCIYMQRSVRIGWQSPLLRIAGHICGTIIAIPHHSHGQASSFSFFHDVAQHVFHCFTADLHLYMAGLLDAFMLFTAQLHNSRSGASSPASAPGRARGMPGSQPSSPRGNSST